MTVKEIGDICGVSDLRIVMVWTQQAVMDGNIRGRGDFLESDYTSLPLAKETAGAEESGQELYSYLGMVV